MNVRTESVANPFGSLLCVLIPSSCFKISDVLASTISKKLSTPYINHCREIDASITSSLIMESSVFSAQLNVRIPGARLRMQDKSICTKAKVPFRSSRKHGRALARVYSSAIPTLSCFRCSCKLRRSSCSRQLEVADQCSGTAEEPRRVC